MKYFYVIFFSLCDISLKVSGVHILICMQISCASASVSDAKAAKYACKSRAAAAFVFDVSGRRLLKLAFQSMSNF